MFARFLPSAGLGASVALALATFVTPVLTSTVADSAQSGLLEQIKTRGVLKVGIAADPPFEARTPSGGWVGYLPALEEAFAKSLGVKIEFVPTTFTTIVAGLQAGKYDLAGADLHITEERKRAIDFSKPFYASGTSYFVLPATAETHKDLQSFNAPDVTIAVVAGSSDDSITRSALPKAKVLALPNVGPGDLILQVKTDKVTAIGVSSYFTPALTERFGLIVRPSDPDGIGSLPVAWGIRKDTPDLRKAADDFLDKAAADGTIEALKKNYLTANAFLSAFSLGSP
jgi:ABC-type amino acid transport substrate-binding protein